MTVEIELKMAADIRRIDGDHTMGASKLAEELVAVGWRNQTPWYINPENGQPTQVKPSEDAEPTDPDALIEGLTISLRPETSKLVFQQGEHVEVSTDWGWVNGHITEVYPYGLIAVHTERGPVSVMAGAKRIRKALNV